ncbi:hypothetical protein DPMN_057335 [Dreissena polymorpha]|uniref:Uncharacterized protein n=1 Tax=Dreissena polymorpha TaxID=45954 RepID=A0A9D4BZY2_DREPO|nr:hypothetical protein DPMN_057335 [Dreissena polymorpha]
MYRKKEASATGTTLKYVIPQRRRNISLADDDGRSDTTPILRRSTRIRRTPKRFTSDEFTGTKLVKSVTGSD